MAEFARVLDAAIAKYLKGAANETIENSILLSRLKRHGSLVYNQSGTSLDWRIKITQRALSGVEDMESIQFTRQNLYESATLPWRGYRMQDAISRKERLMVKGKEAIIDIWGRKMRDMMEDANDRLSAELFVDGNGTGNSKRFHGLESIFGAATSTTTSQYATSSESYAGLSPTAVHGTNSTTTPYSPHLVNDTYTNYSSWATSPTEITRALISACTVNNNAKSRPDLILTTEARYLQFKDILASEEQIQAGPPTRETTHAGFKGISYEGTEVVWDYDCTSSVTYCLNLKQMGLYLLTPNLWYSESGYSHAQDSYQFSVNIWGNMKINPRYQGKSADY
jgi:hypothetical protein